MGVVPEGGNRFRTKGELLSYLLGWHHLNQEGKMNNEAQAGAQRNWSTDVKWDFPLIFVVPDAREQLLTPANSSDPEAFLPIGAIRPRLLRQIYQIASKA